jgi:hypothetical protein
MSKKEVFLVDYNGYKVTVDDGGSFHGRSTRYDNEFDAEALYKLTDKIDKFLENAKKGNLHPKKVEVFKINSHDLTPATITSIAEHNPSRYIQVWLMIQSDFHGKRVREKDALVDYSGGWKFCLANKNNAEIKAKLDEQDEIIKVAKNNKAEIVKGVTDFLTEEMYLATQREEKTGE